MNSYLKNAKIKAVTYGFLGLNAVALFKVSGWTNWGTYWF